MEGPVPAVNFDVVLQLLGRMNYVWTNTETLLVHFIAGLAGVDKETAIVIFLTLNTTRARFDLVDRLAKMGRLDDKTRDDILSFTGQMKEVLKHKNQYNHCLYSFDPDGLHAKTIMMRIAESKHGIKFGKESALDAAEMKRIRNSIDRIEGLNRAAWRLIVAHKFPV